MVNAEEVLDPRALSLEDLRALRNNLQMEDDEVSYKAQLPFIASLASPRHKCVTASVEHTSRNHSHRFCLVSRFGLAAIIGAATLTPARTVPAHTPRWL